MKNKKACKNCKLLTTKKKCPSCGSDDLVGNWKGLVIIFDPENSKIAKKMEITTPGEYALKLR